MNLFILGFLITLIGSKELDQALKAIGRDNKENEQIKLAEEKIEPTKKPIIYPEKPSGAVDLSNNPSSIGDYKTIYGCDLIINKRLYASKSRLMLYYCTFKSIGSIESTNKGGAIYLILSSNSNIPKEVYEIEQCTFEECKSPNGGAIYIENTQITYNIQITNSKFKNNEATTQGGAIYIKHAWMNIEECEFINNKCKQGGDIYFIYGATKTGTNVNFTYHKCTFKHEFSETDTTQSLIFIMYDTNARFYFYDNQLDIINPTTTFHVFDSGDPITSNGKYVFSNNCISSTDESIIASSSASSLNINFETDFRSSCPNINPTQPIEPTQDQTESTEPTQEPIESIEPTKEPIICPEKPSGTVDDLKNNPLKYTSKSVLYGCDLEIQTKINSEEHCVHLYYCTFNKLQATGLDEGGAIYIKTSSNGPTEKKNHIYRCTFKQCYASNGGAIAVATAQTSRFFNITSCIFENNEAMINGGAAYFKIVYATIESSKFINNKAGDNGGEIYFLCGENKGGSSQNPFLIQNNKFELTVERNTNMLYLEWTNSADFIFTNNEVKIISTNTNHFFGSEGNLNEGKMSISSNCISPSKNYICNSSNTALFNKVQNGFPNLCESTEPTDPTESIEPTQEPIESNEPTITNEPTQIPMSCPTKPTSKLIDISNDNYKIEPFYNIYGCNLIVKKRIDGDRCHLIIYNCQFKSMTSSTVFGGAIFIGLSSNGGISSDAKRIELCTFEECSAKSGGAIYIASKHNDHQFIMKENKFNNNAAQINGGAI